MDIEQLKADREAGTDDPREWVNSDLVREANKRRLNSVPELEAAVIAAEKLAEIINRMHDRPMTGLDIADAIIAADFAAILKINPKGKTNETPSSTSSHRTINPSRRKLRLEARPGGDPSLRRALRPHNRGSVLCARRDGGLGMQQVLRQRRRL